MYEIVRDPRPYGTGKTTTPDLFEEDPTDCYDHVTDDAGNPAVQRRVKSSPTLDQNDGVKGTYYDWSEGSSCVQDEINADDMGYNQGNIFKAAKRWGKKSRDSLRYDLEKIIYFAFEELVLLVGYDTASKVLDKVKRRHEDKRKY